MILSSANCFWEWREGARDEHGTMLDLSVMNKCSERGLRSSSRPKLCDLHFDFLFKTPTPVSTFRRNQPSTLTLISRLYKPRNCCPSRRTSGFDPLLHLCHPLTPPMGLMISSKADKHVYLDLFTSSINNVVPAQTIRRVLQKGVGDWRPRRYDVLT